jgi:general secretion pathway protein H
MPTLSLGPEATIGPQRVVLTLEQQQVTLATDGIGPFGVVDSQGPSS